MKTFKEIKEIAKCMEKMKMLSKRLGTQIDTEGIEWCTAEFVSIGKAKIERFKKSNGVTEDYFVEQWTGYCEDDFHGYLYFKTDVPGQYVKVYFQM